MSKTTTRLNDSLADADPRVESSCCSTGIRAKRGRSHSTRMRIERLMNHSKILDPRIASLPLSDGEKSRRGAAVGDRASLRPTSMLAGQDIVDGKRDRCEYCQMPREFYPTIPRATANSLSQGAIHRRLASLVFERRDRRTLECKSARRWLAFT